MMKTSPVQPYQCNNVYAYLIDRNPQPIHFEREYLRLGDDVEKIMPADIHLIRRNFAPLDTGGLR